MKLSNLKTVVYVGLAAFYLYIIGTNVFRNVEGMTTTIETIENKKEGGPVVDDSSADAKSSDAKSSDAKSSDTKSSESKSSEAKPSDTKPSDTKPSDSESKDAEPSTSSDKKKDSMDTKDSKNSNK
jgi:hypothetical protein